jgi:hypothetical protein
MDLSSFRIQAMNKVDTTHQNVRLLTVKARFLLNGSMDTLLFDMRA